MIALPLALLLAAAQPVTPGPAATPSAATPPAATPSPTPTPAVAATPVASPLESPPASPLSPQTAPATPIAPTPSAPPPSPEPTLNYTYRFVPHQPAHLAQGQPQIFAVYLNSNKLKSLGPIDIKVTTSADVVRVFTHSNGHDGDIPMIAAGDFEAIGKLPKLPFIASGVSTVIDFVAVGQSGKRVTVPVPVLLQ